MGGVQITPTVLIIFFHDEGKKIAKIEGATKIQIAVKSGTAEKTIRTFMEQRMKSKMAERLAGELALRMAIGVAAASARRSAGMSREQQMRDEFEKEMEREINQSMKRTNEPQIRELTDEEAKQEAS